MRRAGLFSALLTLLTLSTTAAQDPYGSHVAKTDPLSPAEERKLLRLPPGFDIELVAAEPQIHKPMNMNFDDRGRLWVTDTVEYPFPVPAGKTGRDTVKILEDFGPDGRARKVTTFADGLNIPIGILPLPGGTEAIVHSIPNIWRMSDTDGDGKADQREVLFGPHDTRDTHGMVNSFTWGFDGWIYATHGFANNSTLKGKNGQGITMNSGNTFRFKPDGSKIEQFTWGQVNPFGLCFDPRGDLYAADCHSKPAMLLLRGGYYQSFGKPHDGLGFAPEMVDRYDDSTAIAGIVYYAADQFPAAYRDRLYIGDVVTHNIVQFDLEWHGSTPTTKQKYFLKSDDPWFRPVDIKLGPDGALYVADFYNRIIGHYEVPLNHPGRDRERGRIWRITYKGEGVKPQAAFPRDMTTATAEELAKGTTHPNLTVRTLATNQLVARQVQISKVMGGLPEGDAKGPIPLPPHAEHLFWAQERLGQLGGSLGLWVGGATPQGWETLIVHAFRIYAQRRELVKGIGMLGSAPTNYHTEGLRSSDPFVRRASADAAGQQPRPEYITPLLAALAKVPAADTHLRHTIRMALRNQLLPDGAYANLPNPLADADLKAVADVSLGVPAATAAAFLAEHLDQLGARPEFVQHCARFGAADLQKDLVARVRKAAGADLGRQVALFRAVQQGTQARGAGLDQPAKAWADDLVPQLLAARDGGQIQAGIDLAQALRLAAAQPALTALATATGDEGRRAAACGALLAIDAAAHLPLLGKLLLDAAEPIGLRERVAQSLAGLNRAEAYALLVQGLPVAPARLQSAIAAGMAGSPQGAGQLLDAVAAGKASARLLLEAPVRVRLDQAKVPGLADRVAQLTKGLPPVDQKLVDLINRRRGGFLSARPDAQLGAQVFTKHCANCHQIGGQGAKVGPQLDGIGARGLDRLLEDTLDPNRNVDQAFRATTLGLSNGQVMTGLVLREEGEVVVLADAQGKEQRIPKGQIEQRATSQLSPMPANVADQVPEADFYHLLAYLLAQRAAPTKP